MNYWQNYLRTSFSDVFNGQSELDPRHERVGNNRAGFPFLKQNNLVREDFAVVSLKDVKRDNNRVALAVFFSGDNSPVKTAGSSVAALSGRIGVSVPITGGNSDFGEFAFLAGRSGVVKKIKSLAFFFNAIFSPGAVSIMGAFLDYFDFWRGSLILNRSLVNNRRGWFWSGVGLRNNFLLTAKNEDEDH
jgi:hypothetical protein